MKTQELSGEEPRLLEEKAIMVWKEVVRLMEEPDVICGPGDNDRLVRKGGDDILRCGVSLIRIRSCTELIYRLDAVLTLILGSHPEDRG